jgi:sigma-B regulation protein RsbU (phosphoserine phosphatase)
MPERKLLFVDDEPDFSAMVEQQYEGKINGYDVSFIFAKNGAEALQKLKENKDIEVVLTDINMPVMDGLEFLNQANKLERLFKIIIISAYSDMPNIRKAMNRGAYDFIIKPVDFTDLTDTIVKTFKHLEKIKVEAIELKRLQEIEKEMEMVKKIQASMLPSAVTPFFRYNTFDVFGTLVAARIMGGSFYDYFPVGENKLAIVAGETDAKGIAAAIYVSSAREAIRRFTNQNSEISYCIKQINDYLCYQKTLEVPSFAIFYGIFNTLTGELEYISAGMPSPFVLTKDQQIIDQEAGKSPVGVSLNDIPPIKKLALKKDEAIFIYSKGILQLKNKNSEHYSEKHLKDLIKANSTLPLATLVDAIILDVRDFISPFSQMNDYVVLCLKPRNGS